jgi:hypothetical protein
MKNTLHKLSVISLILLSACSVSKQQVATPAVDLVPTATVFATKTPTQTASTATPTITVIVETPTKNYDALLARLLPNCGNAELSPSKTWATGFCNDDETWIVGVGQRGKWSISYGEFYGKKFDSGNGVIAPYHWTSDNYYLDLAIQRGVVGPLYYVDGWGLVRLNLANGNIAEVLKPIQHHYYSFSFSPDGKSIAYILQPATPLVVKVMNLESKEVKSYPLNSEYNQAGDILWSPDMSKLVLGQAIIDPNTLNSDVIETNPNIFSIVLINLADNSRQLVVSDNLTFTRPMKWHNENRIWLLDENAKDWIYDVADQILLEETQ